MPTCVSDRFWHSPATQNRNVRATWAFGRWFLLRLVESCDGRAEKRSWFRRFIEAALVDARKKTTAPLWGRSSSLTINSSIGF